jgi:ribosome recycling factor
MPPLTSEERRARVDAVRTAAGELKELAVRQDQLGTLLADLEARIPAARREHEALAERIRETCETIEAALNPKEEES